MNVSTLILAHGHTVYLPIQIQGCQLSSKQVGSPFAATKTVWYWEDELGMSLQNRNGRFAGRGRPIPASPTPAAPLKNKES